VRAELRDRYGELPEQADCLFEVAEIRLLLGRRGARTLTVQQGVLRVEPLVLLDSEEVRLKRIFAGAVYKLPAYQVVLPLPAATPGGVPRWVRGAFEELFRDE